MCSVLGHRKSLLAVLSPPTGPIIKGALDVEEGGVETIISRVPAPLDVVSDGSDFTGSEAVDLSGVPCRLRESTVGKICQEF